MKSFEDMLIIVLKSYNMKFKSIKKAKIKTLKDERECKQIAQDYLNEKVSVCFWILWGAKKNGVNYDKIKRFLVNELPVPS